MHGRVLITGNDNVGVDPDEILNHGLLRGKYIGMQPRIVTYYHTAVHIGCPTDTAVVPDCGIFANGGVVPGLEVLTYGDILIDDRI